MSTDGSRVSTVLGRVTSVFGLAALLVRKQAELAKLTNFTLPKMHHAIGKRLMSAETLPADLEPQRAEIRDLESRIAAGEEREAAAVAKPSGDGIAAKAAMFARKAARKAVKATADAAATLRIQAGCIQFGGFATKLHGESVVPADLRAEYEEVVNRRARLVNELSALKVEGAGHWVTPWRVAQAAGLAALLSVGWIVFAPGRTVDGNLEVSTPTPAVGNVGQAVASVSQETGKPRLPSSPSSVIGVSDEPERVNDGSVSSETIDQGEDSWRLIPPSTKALLHIDVRNAVQSPQWRANQVAVAETAYGQQGIAMLAEVEATYGFRYERDLDRIMVAFSMPDGNPLSDILLVAYGDFKPERVALVTKALKGAAILKWRGTSVIRIEQPNDKAAYLSFLSSKCAVLSLDEDAVRDAITRAADGSGGLSPSLAAAMRSQSAGTHVFLGISPAALVKAPRDLKELAENANWGSVSLDSNRSGPGATLTVQAKSEASAKSLERWVDQNILRDKAGNPTYQGLLGGIRPMSEAIQVLRTGRTVRVVLKDLR